MSLSVCIVIVCLFACASACLFVSMSMCRFVSLSLFYGKFSLLFIFSVVSRQSDLRTQ